LAVRWRSPLCIICVASTARGATAITAVIGGSQVHALGYQFVLTPVLLNTVIILVSAWR